MIDVRTAPSFPVRLLCPGMLAVALVLSAHVESVAGLQAGMQSWTTTPDYRIDEPEGSDSGFGRFSRMRVGENGTRIVVRDSKAVGASVTWRILVFSPQGGCSRLWMRRMCPGISARP